MKLKDKVAIVTGAASGIGRAIAMRYAPRGREDRHRRPKLAQAEAVGGEIGAAGAGVAMDVTNEEAVDTGVAGTVAAFGGIDILVSNAGIQIVHPVEDFSTPNGRRCWRSISTVRS